MTEHEEQIAYFNELYAAAQLPETWVITDKNNNPTCEIDLKNYARIGFKFGLGYAHEQVRCKNIEIAQLEAELAKQTAVMDSAETEYYWQGAEYCVSDPVSGYGMELEDDEVAEIDVQQVINKHKIYMVNIYTENELEIKKFASESEAQAALAENSALREIFHNGVGD